MGVVERYPNGTFCWVDLGTNDAAGAKEFYGGLLGWEFDDLPTGDKGTYSTCRLAGRAVAGLYDRAEEPGWGSYLSVEDVDSATGGLRSWGRACWWRPFDTPGGRVSTVRDPAGAAVSLSRPGEDFGAEVVNQDGAWTWNELVSGDLAAARDFYVELLGWSADDAPGTSRGPPSPSGTCWSAGGTPRVAGGPDAALERGVLGGRRRPGGREDPGAGRDGAAAADGHPRRAVHDRRRSAGGGLHRVGGARRAGPRRGRVLMVIRVPFTGDEKQSLRVALDRHRDAVLWKLEGLGDDDLRRAMTPSGTNLLGLVKHLAAVEYGWFCDTFGRPTEPLPFDDDDPDADLRVRPDETTEDVLAFYGRARAAPTGSSTSWSSRRPAPPGSATRSRCAGC